MLERILLVPRARAVMRMCTFNHAYATLYAVECSAEELRTVEIIDTLQITRLGRGMQHYLEESGRIPHIRVFCFGSSANLQKTPSGIRHWAREPFGEGTWVREMRAAIILFGANNPIRKVIIHELTHALLDVLTGGFPYPIAIAEGFARRAEYLLPDGNGTIEWERRCTGGAKQRSPSLSDARFMSIRQLLFFDAGKHWRQDLSAFLKMTNVSFWLNVYLFKLARRHPRVRQMLAELRRKEVRTPEAVYSWLCEVCDTDAGKLEEGFRRFCKTGVMADS